jgi:hypothetical protein
MVLAAAAVVVAAPANGGLIHWPVADGLWHPLMVGGAVYTDDAGDVSPKCVDVVGTAAAPAGLWFLYDGGTSDQADDELMFRLRLSQGATNGHDYPGNLGHYVWQVIFDVDGDDLIDWSLQVDNSGDNEVELLQAIVGGPTFGDVVLSSTQTWSGSLTDHSRLVDPTGDGQHVGSGTDDAFLDFGIGWADFSAATGLEQDDMFSVGLATSTSHSTNNKDNPPDLPTGLADVVLVPEPDTAVMLGLAFLLMALWRVKW